MFGFGFSLAIVLLVNTKKNQFYFLTFLVLVFISENSRSDLQPPPPPTPPGYRRTHSVSYLTLFSIITHHNYAPDMITMIILHSSFSDKYADDVML